MPEAPNKIMQTINTVKNLFTKQPLVYTFLLLVLAASFFVRVYRLDQLLGFYYDQGRDALVIWKFWYEGKFFLIGPITGIEGIYRGPWYYWLIAPFYLLGGGDPVWPIVFLALTTVIASFILFKLASSIAGWQAGLLALSIASFSYPFIYTARWLSNPTPMFLVSMLIVLFMFFVIEGKRWAWVGIGAMLGMAMQFGSAAEIFYFPAVIIFSLLQRKNLPGFKVGILSLLALLIAFLPQIIFDLRHQGVLSVAVKKFLIEEESFKSSFWETIKVRSYFYQQVFLGKIFPLDSRFWLPTILVLILSLTLNAKKLFRNPKFVAVVLLFVTPLVGMLFFQGNKGNIYDYYFTGYYLIFVLIFSVLISVLTKRIRGLIVVFLFLTLFLQDNITLIKNYLVAGVDGPTHISLGNELQAVDWVFQDSKGREFNADVYVPPVIPYAYDYLFLWQANRRCGPSLCGMILDRRVPLLYTLYEVDPPHPERLDAWLERQKGIGEVKETVRFGGITVERRHRIEQDNNLPVGRQG